MKLSDILYQLEKGELRQISDSLMENTVHNSGSVNTFIPFIQSALSALHLRFPLRSKTVLVELSEGQTLYKISSQHAYSNTESMELKYILDSEDSFKDDILSIDNVKNAKGEEIPLNQKDDMDSIIKEEYNVLRVPFPKNDEILYVHYRADYPEINNEDLDPEEVDINIPYVFLQAIVFAIAARMHGAIPTLEGETNQQRTYVSLYERECQKIEGQNIIHRKEDSIEYFRRDGWA